MIDVADLARRIVDAVEQVIVGKTDRVRTLVIALLARGHVLLEDVPGTGKTMLARSLAGSLGLEFKRVQCTPDLLPNDVVGVNVFDPRSTEFTFRPGPVFANVVLADEVNRATPRTQAALLESMQERQVTVDGLTRPLPSPFMVLATQNPIELEGTFPLPEAQLDRFLLSVGIGYPAAEAEATLVRTLAGTHPVEAVRPVATPQEVSTAIEAVDSVHLAAEVARYVVEITTATRLHSGVSLGASPRASIALGAAARARAAVEGRDFVLPDDVKAMAGPVLTHRLMLAPEARLHGHTAATILDRILGEEPVESDTG